MQLKLLHKLPFVAVELTYLETSTQVDPVLVDTGSAGTVMSADSVAAVQIYPEPDDILRMIRGVGGVEAVYTRRVDQLQVGSLSLADFEIEVGGMDYGFEIAGILGMDFLIRAGAKIDLGTMDLTFRP